MVSKHVNATHCFSWSTYVGAEITSKSGLLYVSFDLHWCFVKGCIGHVIISALSFE